MSPTRYPFLMPVSMFLLGLAYYCSCPEGCAAQSDERIQGPVIEIKGDYVKIDFSGAKIPKGTLARVARGDSGRNVGKVRITVSNDKYTVGKVLRGKMKVDDVVTLEAETDSPVPERGSRLADRSSRGGGKAVEETLAVTPLGKEEFEASVHQLFRAGGLTRPANYASLRNLSARRFHSMFEQEIQEATSDAEFRKWLEEHTDIREELYTAIATDFDRVPKVLQIFSDLWKKYPEKIEEYSELAIATAVVWDDPRATYTFRHHQKRAKASLPEGQMGPFDNFRFLVDTEDYMQGRICLLYTSPSPRDRG